MKTVLRKLVNAYQTRGGPSLLPWNPVVDELLDEIERLGCMVEEYANCLIIIGRGQSLVNLKKSPR